MNTETVSVEMKIHLFLAHIRSFSKYLLNDWVRIMVLWSSAFYRHINEVYRAHCWAKQARHRSAYCTIPFILSTKIGKITWIVRSQYCSYPWGG